MVIDTEALRAAFEDYIEGDVALHWQPAGYYAGGGLQGRWLDFQSGYWAGHAVMANKEQPVSDPMTTERAAFEAWLSKATAEEGPWPSTRECAWSAWQAARRAQPAREPLTGAQVSGGFANCGLGGINAKLGFNAGVRFAENAHGITQKDAG